MKIIQKGERHQLSDLLNGDQNPEFIIEVDTSYTGIPNDGLDISVFCLNANKKMDSEYDIIFFNNKNSLGGEVVLQNPSRNEFLVSIPNIQRSNNRVQSLVVCACIDQSIYSGTFGNAFANRNNSIKLNLKYRGLTVATAVVNYLDVAQEKALMLFECYVKNGVWRLSNVTQGFNGGMRDLILFHGGEVEDQPVPNYQNNSGVGSAAFSNQHSPGQSWNQSNSQGYQNGNNQNGYQSGYNQNHTPNNSFQQNQANSFGQQNSFQEKQNLVSLKKEKILNEYQRKAPNLVSLAKNSLQTLERKNLLGLQAKVALVLDSSGSMSRQYDRGDVQRVVERLMPIASSFDDDGEFECWAFAENPYQLDDVNLSNLSNYVQKTRGGWKNWRVGSRVNNEVDAIDAVIEFYSRNNPQNLPIYVLFISDGGVHADKQIEKVIRKSTQLPIFWQFVGIGGANYGILEKLDTMTGRTIDNCNFFALDNINQLNDSEIYENLLNEFPSWIAEAKRIGLIRNY